MKIYIARAGSRHAADSHARLIREALLRNHLLINPERLFRITVINEQRLLSFIRIIDKSKSRFLSKPSVDQPANGSTILRQS